MDIEVVNLRAELAVFYAKFGYAPSATVSVPSGRAAPPRRAPGGETKPLVSPVKLPRPTPNSQPRGLKPPRYHTAVARAFSLARIWELRLELGVDRL